MAGSVNKCLQTQQNPPQSWQEEKSNTYTTSKQENNTTDYSSATNQPTTFTPNTNPKILNVLISLENNGLSKSVINSTRKELSNLARTADLNSPEQLKQSIAKMQTGNVYKRMLVQAYNRYAKYYKLQWEAPKYQVASQEITVPTDEKLNMLIATAKKPLSTKLQVSNETGIRPVELCKLQVKDYDNDTRTIHQRTAKHGNPRQLKISPQLQTLLNNHIQQHMLQPADYLFGGTPEKYSFSFQRIKNTLSERINDPSIKKIRLYDLRHAFCMRMIDNYPSDPYMVMYLMGHKHLTTTEKYFHIKKYLQDFQKEEYDCKHAKTIQEATELIQAGYTKQDEIDGIHLYRKRK